MGVIKFLLWGAWAVVWAAVMFADISPLAAKLLVPAFWWALVSTSVTLACMLAMATSPCARAAYRIILRSRPERDLNADTFVWLAAFVVCVAAGWWPIALARIVALMVSDWVLDMAEPYEVAHG